jgi:hypothetical protein
MVTESPPAGVFNCLSIAVSSEEFPPTDAAYGNLSITIILESPSLTLYRVITAHLPVPMILPSL